jgi:hypothetical protein
MARRDRNRHGEERDIRVGRERARRRAKPEGIARALAPLGREPIPQGGAIFPPGEPLRPTPGIEAAGGRPRQWAFPVGYNIGQRPRATEQTSFEQLRNLAALYDGIQLCVHALQRSCSPLPGVSEIQDSVTR